MTGDDMSIKDAESGKDVLKISGKMISLSDRFDARCLRCACCSCCAYGCARCIRCVRRATEGTAVWQVLPPPLPPLPPPPSSSSYLPCCVCAVAGWGWGSRRVLKDMDGNELGYVKSKHLTLHNTQDIYNGEGKDVSHNYIGHNYIVMAQDIYHGEGKDVSEYFIDHSIDRRSSGHSVAGIPCCLQIRGFWVKGYRLAAIGQRC